jgi:outer membrane receptor for monomeric catechols
MWSLRKSCATSTPIVTGCAKERTGVSFSTGDGQRDQVTIRGFPAISEQYVDGIRDDVLYFRDLSNVERVEVIQGPAPAPSMVVAWQAVCQPRHEETKRRHHRR